MDTAFISMENSLIGKVLVNDTSVVQGPGWSEEFNKNFEHKTRLRVLIILSKPNVSTNLSHIKQVLPHLLRSHSQVLW